MHVNFEFKARHNDIEAAQEILLTQNPRWVGEDHQVDTYFNVPVGRLKLREGTIEQSLIFYQRANTAGAKQSNVILYNHPPHASLKQALIAALGVKVVVDKQRRIYFVGHVKFHFDRVRDLGTFLEVEAIDADGSVGLPALREQCERYRQLLGIGETDLVAESYSDLLLAKKSSTA